MYCLLKIFKNVKFVTMILNETGCYNKVKFDEGHDDILLFFIDLVPPRNGRQPSRRSTEAEKSAAIIEHVVEMDKHFCCFTCLKYFANFHQVNFTYPSVSTNEISLG